MAASLALGAVDRGRQRSARQLLPLVDNFSPDAADSCGIVHVVVVVVDGARCSANPTSRPVLVVSVQLLRA